MVQEGGRQTPGNDSDKTNRDQQNTDQPCRGTSKGRGLGRGGGQGRRDGSGGGQGRGGGGKGGRRK